MKSYIIQNKTFWVLVVDGVARLVFYSEDAAKKFLSEIINYEGTTIQKVYGETEWIEQ